MEKAHRMNYKKAREAEKTGELEEAARAYATLGFAKLLDSNFAVDGRMRIATAHLSEAMSCDARAENTTRAAHLFEFVRLNFEEIRANTESSVLIGLTYEWEADGLLYLGRPGIIERYQTAQSQYRDLSWTDERWVDEPDFMHFYWAYEGFIESHSLSESTHLLECSFSKRIDEKIEFANKLMETLLSHRSTTHGKHLYSTSLRALFRKVM